jgi:hypothetical protein
MSGRSEYPTRLTAKNVATILMQAVADGKSSRGYRSLVSIVATLFCPVGVGNSITGQADVSRVTLGAISKMARDLANRVVPMARPDAIFGFGSRL